MSIKLRLNGVAKQEAERLVPGLVSDLVASRLTAQDPTLWGPEAEPEASIRLGWIDAVSTSRPLVPEILALRDEFLAKGLNRFVLAGMGGSSLAPELITKTAGVELVILDSTAPGQVIEAITGDPESGGLAETVLIVSSKSGSTIETDSAKRAFEAAFVAADIDPAERIVIVTDPGSPLEAASLEAGYRVFNADPNVGGRYSALTAFGLVPSGLAGADINELLDEAESALLPLAIDDASNPSLVLAAAIAGGAPKRDKVGLVADGTHIDGIGDWIEQLIAESTGKSDKGLLPIVLLPVSPEVTDTPSDVQIVRLVQDADHGHLFEHHANEVLLSGSLGAQIMLWEYATAIAGRILGIDPFNQPDVESAKVAARGLLDARPEPSAAAFIENGVEVRSSDSALVASGNLADVFDALWATIPEGGYVSIQAYVDRNNLEQLSGLRELVAADSKTPTTFGWGPRFLHSTGQYHKGGPDVGVFIQILESNPIDLEIPGRPFTFGELINAQAVGDAKVLSDDHTRPVLTLTLTEPETDILALFEAAQ